MAADKKKNGRSGTPIPLNLPQDLQAEVETVATEGGISNQDVMRLAIRRGLPKVKAFFRKPKAA